MRLTDEVVKKYWDEKAKEDGLGPMVTIKDHHFRELEIDVIRDYLNNEDIVLDVGCGNGYSTLVYARDVNRITGVDYSEEMIEKAREYHKLNVPSIKNADFQCADARNLPFLDGSFDVVIMERCLINIPDANEQKIAVKEAQRVLKSGGLFLLSEVTLQGHQSINRLREMFGLDKLKVHWHNTYLDEEQFIPFLEQYFEVKDIVRFGMYGLISKVIHPLLVAPEEPKFEAKINEIARAIGRKFINFEDASHHGLFVLRRRGLEDVIPLVDLKQQYQSIADEVGQKVLNVLRSGDYILGEEVDLFEQEFASYCQAKYGVGVNSGTDALHLALRACGISQGDEVITAANTYIATVLAISFAGAKPVLVDIDPKTYTIDVSRIEKAMTNNTKAIIPIHLYGQPVNMDPILELAKKYKLKVVEDACQAHGAEYKGKKVGCLGDLGCFSFYPAKNLGAYGDGGMVVTNSEEMADKLRMLRNYGQKIKNYHKIKGFNNRLDTLQAAVLRVKLRKLDKGNDLRRQHASLYNSLLENSNVVRPLEANYAKHVYHLYVVQVEQREGVQQFLSAKGISTGIHYPIPIHLQEAYRDLGYKIGGFPVTEKCVGKILSLPMFPELSKQQVATVSEAVESCS